jgi:hypothetical protein
MLEPTLELLVLLIPHVWPNLAAVGRFYYTKLVTTW